MRLTGAAENILAAAAPIAVGSSLIDGRSQATKGVQAERLDFPVLQIKVPSRTRKSAQISGRLENKA